jgi:hypothetical protein
VATGALFLALCAAAAAAGTPDEAVVASLPAVFALTLLSNYYWALLALLPLRRPNAPTTSFFLLVNAALYAVALGHGVEVQYAAASWGLAAFFLIWLAAAAWGFRGAGLPAAAAPAPLARTPPAASR